MNRNDCHSASRFRVIKSKKKKKGGGGGGGGVLLYKNLKIENDKQNSLAMPNGIFWKIQSHWKHYCNENMIVFVQWREFNWIHVYRKLYSMLFDGLSLISNAIEIG